MPDWVTLDLGIGAVGGSIITGAVAVYIDYRKRRDEKRNRDRDKKQQAYTQYSQFIGLLHRELMLMADVRPIVHQISNGASTDADLQELHQVTTRFNTNFEQLEESMTGALNQIAMIAPKHVRDAAVEVLGACLKLAGHLKQDDEDDEIEATEDIFNKLMYEFRIAARADLGIHE